MNTVEDLWNRDRRPLALRYHDWRQTALGQDVFRAIERAALDQLAAGERRIEINLLWAQIRRARRHSADNSYRALVSRELIDTHPQLRGVIRVKKRAGENAA